MHKACKTALLQFSILLLTTSLYAHQTVAPDAVAVSPFVNLLTHTTALMNDLLNKLPCDLPTSIRKEDIPFVITQPGYYCLADDFTSIDPILIQIVGTHNVQLNLTAHTFDMSGQSNVAIEVNSCSSVQIMNGSIQNSAPGGMGIHICNGSQKVSIDGITTNNCATGVKIEDSNSVTINNSLFKNGQIGIECLAATNSCYDFVIKKSSCINNTTTGIQLMGGASTILSEIKIRECHILNDSVNTSSTQPTYGIQVAQTRGLTIQEVTLDTNSYGISFTNACNIKITHTKVLNTAFTAIETFNSSGTALQDHIQSYIFDTVTIDGAAQNMALAHCSNVTLKNCHLLNATQSAVSLTDCSTVHMDGSIFSTQLSSSDIVAIGSNSAIDSVNTVRMSNCVISGSGLNGIHIAQAANVCIEHSTISSSSLSKDINGSVILVEGTVPYCLISHCMVSGSSSHIITYANTTANDTHVTINDCRIFGAQQEGILVTNASHATIRDCEIGFCATGINLVSAQAVTVMHSIIHDCDLTGIALDEGCARCGVRDNVITSIWDPVGNDGVGINNVPNSQSAIFHNYLYGNEADCQNVQLTVAPAPAIGAHENICSSQI